MAHGERGQHPGGAGQLGPGALLPALAGPPLVPGQAGLARAGAWFRRYGLWSLLFAWLPVVGDPLTFVGGIFRVNVWVFLLLVGAGKAARYAAVVLAVQGVLGAP